MNSIRYQFQHGVKYLNYLTDHIVHKIFKSILNISLKT